MRGWNTTKVDQFLLLPSWWRFLTWCLLLLRTSWCSLFQTSQLIFLFYYGSWRPPTSLHCWLAGVYCSIFQYTQRKNVLLTIVFYLHMNFFWGGMTEFWHFSYPFNVRNYPSEFENKRTNTSSVILSTALTALFRWISPRSCCWMFVFLQSAGFKKKKNMVINWGMSLF